MLLLCVGQGRLRGHKGGVGRLAAVARVGGLGIGLAAVS